MKITKQQLTKIIKEAVLAEVAGPTRGQLAELHNIVDRLLEVMGRDELVRALEGLAQEIKMEM